MPEQLRLLGEVLRFCDQSVKDLEESAASWMAPFSPITHDMAYQLDYLVRDLEDLRGIQVYFPKRQRFSTLPTIRVAWASCSRAGFRLASPERMASARQLLNTKCEGDGDEKSCRCEACQKREAEACASLVFPCRFSLGDA